MVESVRRYMAVKLNLSINNEIQAFQSETPRLIDQIELNDQLNQRMEDIYPDIEKTDDISSTAVKKATTQKSKSFQSTAVPSFPSYLRSLISKKIYLL